MTKQLVDFFIVGEPKSGTTALAQFLGEHPRIGISTPKEPHYFCTDLIQESDTFHGSKNHHFPIRSFKQYMKCFTAVSNKPVWGEGSTHYMSSREAATNIFSHNPDARIIVMFRNPVDFVHSLHMQYINNGGEDELDFARALELEPARKRGERIPVGVRTPSQLYYSERITYTEQLERFYKVFPRDRIQVIIMEEFNKDNHKTYLEVLDFLGEHVPVTLPTFTTVHGSKTPRSARLHRTFNHPMLKYAVLKTVGANRYDAVKDTAARIMLKKQPRVTMDPALRARLMKEYRPEVQKLAEMIKRPDLLQVWGYTDTNA